MSYILHTYTFPSKSHPEDAPHTAQMFDDLEVICSCPGYKWRSKCRHITEIKAGEAQPDPGECAEPEGDADASFNIETLEGVSS
jgi:hypothetical protein